MEATRRRLLRVAVTSTAGVALAGCASLAWSCEEPSGDLRGTLPTDGPFEQVYVRQFAEGDDVELAYRSLYEGPDGNRYLLAAAEFPTEEAAKENLAKTRESEEGDAWGSVRVGPYEYSAVGDERDRVEDLLAATEPLDETCVALATNWH